MRRFFLGVAADDFTGASDAASFLVEAGISTVLFNGIPQAGFALEEGVEAVVIALKTRTMPVKQAVEDSLRAFSWLKEMGAEKLYFKYCSTFDSTSEGNIGPVADAVLEKYEIPFTVLCPALPVNGRTVKDGVLYVNGIPLGESHMKDHPLTPMKDSLISKLMEEQSHYPCYPIGIGESIQKQGKHFYVIPDYYLEEHGDAIAETFWELPFFTGGSGLCGALGRCGKKKGLWGNNPCEAENVRETKKAVIFAGSCSAVTLKQIKDYQSKGYPSYQVKPELLVSGVQTAEEIFDWIQKNSSCSLVYSSASPDSILESQRLGKEKIAAMIEKLFSELARRSAEADAEKIIVAGGETSGAVTKALGCQAFYIGKSVAPGVPVMRPAENRELMLILKSGNFGQEDFFERALKI